jgi:hypothetical protein
MRKEPPVPKHIVVLTIVVNCMLFSEVIGAHTGAHIGAHIYDMWVIS